MKDEDYKAYPTKYLSNISALKGFLAVSFGGGIFLIMALRISAIPIPSYKRD